LMNTSSYFDFKEDDKDSINPEELKNLIEEIQSNNEYLVERTETRNILMVGRARAGKSTTGQILKDPCFQPNEMCIFSDTVQPKFQSFSIQDKITKTKYTFNIIDTPGLKEVKRKGEETRSDSVILNVINYCLRNEITKINTLLIFISFDVGVTSDDVESFKTFLELFGHENIQIGFVITRAENKSEKWRESIKQQLNEHEYFSHVLQKTKNLKILFSGCVDQAGLVSNIKDLKKLYLKVYAMRKELMNFIFSSEKQVMLLALPIAELFKNSLVNILKEQNLIIQELEKLKKFFDDIDTQIKIKQFSKNLNEITNNEGLLFDKDIRDSFNEIQKRMKNISLKMDEKTKNLFFGDYEKNILILNQDNKINKLEEIKKFNDELNKQKIDQKMKEEEDLKKNV